MDYMDSIIHLLICILCRLEIIMQKPISSRDGEE